MFLLLLLLLYTLTYTPTHTHIHKHRYAFRRWLSRRKWRVRRFVLGVLQRFRTKRIRKMVVLQERLRSQAERTYVERVEREFVLEDSELRWSLRSQKLLRDLQLRYLDRYVECKARRSVELLRMLLCTTFPRQRDVVFACTSEKIASALNEISFQISDREFTCLVRYLNELNEIGLCHDEQEEEEEEKKEEEDLDEEDFEEDEVKSAVEFETPKFDLVLVANTIENTDTSNQSTTIKLLIRVAQEIEKRFRDESQLIRWARRDYEKKLRWKLRVAAIMRFRNHHPPRVFCSACLMPFSTYFSLSLSLSLSLHLKQQKQQ